MKDKNKKLFRYIFFRIIQIVPLLLLITLVVFLMLSYAPGDPALLLLGPVGATQEKITEVREELGLNKPVIVRYFEFLKNLILHGDMGRSFQSKRPVTQEILRTLPISIRLSFNALVISTILALILGIISAIKQYSIIDNVTKILVLTGVSMPIFWLGLLMIVIFAVYFKIFPSSGWGNWRYMVLPSVTLAAFPLAMLTRLTRSTMLEVIRMDYVRTARAKGLSEFLVIFKHTLRNALIPVITMSGLQFGILISGAVLTETIFAIPGIGRLIVESIYVRDYPVIQGTILVSAAIFALVNLIVDILYSFLDPRITLK